jgi:hypothetical protein
MADDDFYTQDRRAQALIDNLLGEITSLNQDSLRAIEFRALSRAEIALRDQVILDLQERLSEVESERDEYASLAESLRFETERLRLAVDEETFSGDDEGDSVWFSQNLRGATPKIEPENPADPTIDAGNVDLIAQDIVTQPKEKPDFQPSWESEPLVSRRDGSIVPEGTFGEPIVQEPALEPEAYAGPFSTLVTPGDPA